MTGATSFQHFNHDQNMGKPGEDIQPGSAMSSESGSGSNSPELVMSGGVPNPFTMPTQAPPPMDDPAGMTSVNWANHSQKQVPIATPSAPISATTTTTTTLPNPFGPHPGAAAPIAAARSSSDPQFYPAQQPDNEQQGNNGAGLNVRRQKRLERNRESARLSRRRRKQYLEVLEERVKNLSIEMDTGRRAHVVVGVDTVKEARSRALVSGDETSVQALKQSTLSGASLEFRVASTFQTQQVRSLSMPPSMKFILWLSLQNDTFFRGGRAASERLSAARIGERMLKNGNDRVPPAHGMWPLFCNEVGLSYDQEERVRAFQKTLMLNHESWLERHTAKSSVLALQAAHDSGQAVSASVNTRNTNVRKTLTSDQLVKFLSWSDKNSDRIKASADANRRPMESVKKEEEQESFVLSDGNHVAANLYILNHRLQKVIEGLPKQAPMLDAPSLKRLTRRPSFESLGSMALGEKEGGLTREGSFASSGSLKRCASELSDIGEEEKPQFASIPAQEAEASARPTIDGALGFVRTIIPAPLPQPVAAPTRPAFSLPPPPAPKAIVHQHHIPMPTPVAPAPNMTHILPSNGIHMITPNNSGIMAPQQQHQQYHSHPPPVSSNMHHHHQVQQVGGHLSSVPVGGSFLPPHLQIVSEEGFIPGNAEDFLFDLAEEDWAIGEGFADAMETA